MYTDFIVNGQGHGPLAEALAGVRFDPGMLRPYVDKNGTRCVSVTNAAGGQERRSIGELMSLGISHPVWNATTMRKEDWTVMDQAVTKATRQRLRAWSDLAAANSYSGFNGMGKLFLESETMTDAGEAFMDMDPVSSGRRDLPTYSLYGTPLPVTHSDFWFTARQLAVSRNGGTPLDTTMAEQAGRKVAEMVEQVTIGTVTGLTYGSAAAGSQGIPYTNAPTVFGYTNHPDRILKTDLTTPTGTNPEAIMTDVIEMRELLYTAGFFGPFILYHSTGYDRYLDDDYFRSGATTGAMARTLRQRIQEIDGITAVRRLDYLTSGYQMILIQMTADVARAINGMDLTTVMWETLGGMRINFKVMAIWVPQIRANGQGDAGIVHGTTS